MGSGSEDSNPKRIKIILTESSVKRDRRQFIYEIKFLNDF
jgi:hypothetical protein